MDENKDPEEYAETFRHEYGHFMDDILGRISMSDNFGFALDADKYWLDNSKDEGIENFSAMLDDLSSTDGKRNLLSMLFMCESLAEKYRERGIGEAVLLATLSDLVIWTNT